MSVRDKIEIEIDGLKNRREELEESMRFATRECEAERDNISYVQRKRDELWDNYGTYAPELESILDEENAYIENFKIKFEEYEEQIQKEYNRETEHIDREINGLREEIHSLEDVEEKGDEQDGDW